MTENAATETLRIADQLWPNIAKHTSEIELREVKRRLRCMAIDAEQAKAALTSYKLDPQTPAWPRYAQILAGLVEAGRTAEPAEARAPEPSEQDGPTLLQLSGGRFATPSAWYAAEPEEAVRVMPWLHEPAGPFARSVDAPWMAPAIRAHREGRRLSPSAEVAQITQATETRP